MDNLERGGKAAATAREYSPGVELETAIGDLLADLHHACNVYGLEWSEVVDASNYHYESEVEEERDEKRDNYCHETTVAELYAALGGRNQQLLDELVSEVLP